MNPHLPNISKIIRSYSHFINDSPTLVRIFPKGSIISSYRRTKNIKELLPGPKIRKNYLRRMRFFLSRFFRKIGKINGKKFIFNFIKPVAQLVEHRDVKRETVSSTAAGPSLRVLKQVRRKGCLCNYISKWLDFQVFSDKDYKP